MEPMETAYPLLRMDMVLMLSIGVGVAMPWFVKVRSPSSHPAARSAGSTAAGFPARDPPTVPGSPSSK